MAEEEKKAGAPVGDAAGTEGLDPRAARRKKILTAGAELLREPFSDATRERQKYLLISAVLTMCLARGIASIESVELEFLRVRVAAEITHVFAFATAYLMILFGIGAWQELTAANYAVKAALVYPMKLLTDTVIASARQVLALDTLATHAAPYWDAVRAAELEYRRKDDAHAERIRRLDEELTRLRNRHAEISQTKESRPEEREARTVELEKVNQRIEKIEERKEDAEVERDEDRSEYLHRPGIIAQGYGASDLSQEIAALGTTVTGDYKGEIPDAVLKLADRSVRYLALRKWAEILLPLIFGAIAVLVGLHPVVIHTPPITPK